MTIKQLRNAIAGLPEDAVFLVSSDEELNSLMSKWEIAELEGEPVQTYCIYGFSGSEVELEDGEVGKHCDNTDCNKTISDLDYANGGGLCENCRK